MMYCPKCGSQNPDGSRFCGTCGMTFAAAPTPQPVPGPVPGPGPRPVPGPTPGLRPTSGGFGLFTIISLVAVLIAAVLLIMPSLAGKDYDDYFEDNSGGACITSFTSDLGHSASMRNDSLADMDDLSRKQEGAMGKMGTAALANSPVYVLWIVAMGSTAIAVFDAIKSKTKGSIPMIVAGFACFLVALLWIIAVGNYFGALDDLHSELEIGVSWTVWVALFAGLAAGVVALLEKLGILRD